VGKFRTPLDNDELRDVLSSPGLKHLLDEVDTLVRDIEQDVIKLVLDTSNERELLLRKARAEGARKLASAFRARIQSLKLKSQ
jgi:hypothetical protein